MTPTAKTDSFFVQNRLWERCPLGAATCQAFNYRVYCYKSHYIDAYHTYPKIINAGYDITRPSIKTWTGRNVGWGWRYSYGNLRLSQSYWSQVVDQGHQNQFSSTSGWSMTNMTWLTLTCKPWCQLTHVFWEDSLYCCFCLYCISAGQKDVCSCSRNREGCLKTKSRVSSGDNHHLATQIDPLNHICGSGPSLMEPLHIVQADGGTHQHTGMHAQECTQMPTKHHHNT